MKSTKAKYMYNISNRIWIAREQASTLMAAWGHGFGAVYRAFSDDKQIYYRDGVCKHFLTVGLKSPRAVFTRLRDQWRAATKN